MNRRSAHILSKGKAEIRAIGEACDASCMMWFCCANSVPNGTCKGFALLDGESRKLLRRNMQEDDLLYLEDCVGAFQNGCSPEAKRSLTGEIFRCLKPVTDILGKEPSERRGFRGMLDQAFPSTPEQAPVQPVIRGFGDGFLGQLEQASRGAQSIIRRSLPSNEKPTCRIFGFYDMLDDASRKYEEEAEQSKAVIRNVGFRGMLDAFSEGRSTPIINPILRKLQQRLRAIRNGM